MSLNDLSYFMSLPSFILTVFTSPVPCQLGSSDSPKRGRETAVVKEWKIFRRTNTRTPALVCMVSFNASILASDTEASVDHLISRFNEVSMKEQITFPTGVANIAVCCSTDWSRQFGKITRHAKLSELQAPSRDCNAGSAPLHSGMRCCLLAGTPSLLVLLLWWPVDRLLGLLLLAGDGGRSWHRRRHRHRWHGLDVRQWCHLMADDIPRAVAR